MILPSTRAQVVEVLEARKREGMSLLEAYDRWQALKEHLNKTPPFQIFTEDTRDKAPDFDYGPLVSACVEVVSAKQQSLAKRIEEITGVRIAG